MNSFIGPFHFNERSFHPEDHLQPKNAHDSDQGLGNSWRTNYAPFYGPTYGASHFHGTQHNRSDFRNERRMNPYSRSDWNRSVSPMSFRWRKEYHACNPHFNDVRERLEPGHDLERCIRSKGAHSFSSSHTYEHSRKRSFHEERVAGNQNYLATKHGWKSTAAEREQAENAESNIDEDCLVVDVRKVDPRLSTKPCIPTPKDTPSHLCQYFLYSDMKGRRPKFDKNGRKTSDYVPSHNAIGSMIEKCLPHSTAKRFSYMFNSGMEKFVDSVSRSLPGKGTADTEFMCKTPVNII